MQVAPFAGSLSRPARLEPIADREFVRESKPPHSKSGFTPRHLDRLATCSKPTTALNLECRHRKRIEENVPYSYFPSVEYRMWNEASKMRPPFPDRPDDNYNFCVWRNFKEAFGLHLPPNRQNAAEHEMLSSCYPICVPKPSNMDENSFVKYLSMSCQFRSELQRQVILRQLSADDEQRKRLAAQTAARNPPISDCGHILPPRGYRRYAPLLLQPGKAGETAAQAPEVTDDMEPDLFGKLVKKRPQHLRLWKLSYRTSNPKYNEAQRYARELRGEADFDEDDPSQLRMLPTIRSPPAAPVQSMRFSER